LVPPDPPNPPNPPEADMGGQGWVFADKMH